MPESNHLTTLMTELKAITLAAGKAVSSIYHSPQELEIKQKADESPVTAADLAAHKLIVAGLSALTPDIPILSEEALEGLDWQVRQQWHRYWLVDPLDGTQEFIHRTGEFTVNIALIEGQDVLMGIVYVPEKDLLYRAIRGQGSFRESQGSATPLHAHSLRLDRPVNVVASRRHGTEALEGLLKRAEEALGDIHKVNMGSSLKICALAEGKADWYPRLAPTSEWDTAAAQIVLEEAGGAVVDTGLDPLRYNTKDSLLNPHFHALADPSYDWAGILLDASSEE